MVGRIARVLLLAVLFAPVSGRAAWQPNGVPATTAAWNQVMPAAVTDGNGGVYVTWYDQPPGGVRLYFQHFDALGHANGPAGGVLLGDTYVQYNQPPQMVEGYLGTAFVVWSQTVSASTAYIRAQHLAGGTATWAPGGVLVSTTNTLQYMPSAVSDGAGGLIVAWEDYRSGAGMDIYAQRMDVTGARLWASGGVAICTRGGGQQGPQLATDGANGAIITWYDYRTPQTGEYGDIFAQRVTGAGTVAWTANGVPVCTATGQQTIAAIVSDGLGGAIVAWTDHRHNDHFASYDFNLYTQRLNASGAAVWPLDGILLGPVAQHGDPEYDWRGTIVSDGSGGAIVVRSDDAAQSLYLRAHRIDAAGNLLWGLGGVKLSDGVYQDCNPHLIMATSDGDGGALIGWTDMRNSTTGIYAQRVNRDGIATWASNGVPVCTAPPTAYLFTSEAYIATDGTSAFMAWRDGRNGDGGGANDIYVQRLELAHGEPGRPEPLLTNVSDVPDDQGGFVAVNWWASDRDQSYRHDVAYYSVWRSVASSFPPTQVVEAPRVKAGTLGPVFTRFADTGSEYYWELVGTQLAVGNAGYSMSARTRSDAIPGGADNGHSFRVLAHSALDEQVTYASTTAYASSVDNLAPLAPVQLAGQRVGDDVHLAWKRGKKASDFKEFALYRGTAAGVLPDPVNLVSSPLDTVYVDANVPPGTLYYVVTSYDVHLNQSGASNEAVVSGATGVGGDTPPVALSILANVPNPFSASTELRIGMPATGGVSLEVFDVAGRRVAQQRFERVPRGWQRLVFDARDATGAALPSGVYFYRISALGETRTRKMVITR